MAHRLPIKKIKHVILDIIVLPLDSKDSQMPEMSTTNFIIHCFNVALVCALLLFIFSACSPVRSIKHYDKVEESHYDALKSPIIAPYKSELERGKDGALLIYDGTSALLHRLAFVQMAQRSIEIQTYIYKNELTSRLLIYEILNAANRGVRVRILVDDNGISSDLYDLVLLDSHENIEVRIFNPYFFRLGFLRAFEAPFDFSRINKRMHNKLFIFDDTAMIMGGRNIGDEYFDNASVNFTDTDLLFIGNVAKEARRNFEEFWSYKRSIPLKFLTGRAKIKRYQKRLEHETKQLYNINDLQWQEYKSDIESFRQKYESKEFKMSFGRAIFISDVPQKVDRNNQDSRTLILDALSYYLNHAKDSIIIASSYLVPGDAALEMWQDFMERGIKIQILTNSLASIDVVPVYSHWEKYRDRLAQMGVEVYEYANFAGSLESQGELDSDILESSQEASVDSNLDSKTLLKPIKARLKDKAKFYNNKKGKVSLHSKNMIIDDRIIAVGSFNLDYRSAMLNTESIVFFESDELASKLKHITQEQMARSYRILYDKKAKRGVWVWGDSSIFSESKAGVSCKARDNCEEKIKIFTSSPNTSIWLRIYKNLAKILPEKLF